LFIGVRAGNENKQKTADWPEVLSGSSQGVLIAPTENKNGTVIVNRIRSAVRQLINRFRPMFAGVVVRKCFLYNAYSLPYTLYIYIYIYSLYGRRRAFHVENEMINDRAVSRVRARARDFWQKRPARRD